MKGEQSESRMDWDIGFVACLFVCSLRCVVIYGPARNYRSVIEKGERERWRKWRRRAGSDAGAPIDAVRLCREPKRRQRKSKKRQKVQKRRVRQFTAAVCCCRSRLIMYRLWILMATYFVSNAFFFFNYRTVPSFVFEIPSAGSDENRFDV